MRDLNYQLKLLCKRQWVISFPFPLRYLFAAHPHAMGKVLGIVYRAISTHLIHKAGFSLKDAFEPRRRANRTGTGDRRAKLYENSTLF